MLRQIVYPYQKCISRFGSLLTKLKTSKAANLLSKSKVAKSVDLLYVNDNMDSCQILKRISSQIFAFLIVTFRTALSNDYPTHHNSCPQIKERPVAWSCWTSYSGILWLIIIELDMPLCNFIPCLWRKIGNKMFSIGIYQIEITLIHHILLIHSIESVSLHIK